MTQSLPSSIITPDQRLRVFVSSTLQELAEERRTVKNAIQNIQLIPVMFETGARPYPPRDIYREYLAQSQIFVGIYWDKYGWIAPEENISGLEDEYNLSGNMPKLIYIKNSSGERDKRLSLLLEKIQADDKVSYKNFSDASELGNLIISDLAVLLTERFNLSLHNKVNANPVFQNLPAVPNALIGREHCIQHITEMMLQPDNRLITLTGPGGIGKTRLAIECAGRLSENYRDGVAFVPLAPVRDPSLVAETISSSMGIKMSSGSALESMKMYLKEKNMLLVLDNFEQVVDAAYVVDELLSAAPGLKILVTSRERLSLSFEQVLAIPGLSDMEVGGENSNSLPPAIELFVKRAAAVKPGFELNENNRDIIYQICHRLEGLPLAIELAAGQINLFSPQLLLQKLDHRLDILKGNFRDIPDRQKTIRNTIEWSFDLLNAEEQELLLRLSLFNSGCLLETAEKLAADIPADFFGMLESLINKSLLSKEDEEMHVRFRMLESVRDFALEKLKISGRMEAVQMMQADYYHDALREMKLQTNGSSQAEILVMLENEHANIRTVMEFLIAKKELKKLTEIAWNLWLFWWVNAHTKEAYNWLQQAWKIHLEQQNVLDDYTCSILACNVGIMSFMQRDFELYQQSLEMNLHKITRQQDDELVATAMLISGVVATIMQQHDRSDEQLLISLEKYRKIGLTTGICLALSALGRNSIYMGNRLDDARAYYRESIELARAEHNEITVIICLSGFALTEAMAGNSDAKNYLRESIILSQNLHFFEALAWSVEIWAVVSLKENKLIHAVTMLGAVDHLRSLTHLPVWDDLQMIIVNAIQQMKSVLDETVFQKAWDEGAGMNIEQMVAFAMKE